MAGAALTEFVIVTALALAPLSLGTLQVALIHNARRVVDYATFEAARDGALHHAQKAPMREAFTRNVLALYGGGTDAAKLVVSRGLAEADLAAPVAPGQRVGAGFKVAILNPAKEAFDDFGESVRVGNLTVREIPNDHLRYRARDVGPTSAVNIQDANLLKIEVIYGYRMVVPVINKLTAAVLKKLDPVNSAYYSADPPRLPIKSVALVRMHSPARADGNLTVAALEAGAPGSGGAVPPPEPGPGTVPPPDDGTGQGGSDGAGGDGNADGGDGTGNGDPVACSGQDPAAQPAQVAALGVGNPINVVTGNKYQREIDLSSLPGPLSLEIVRHYNSRTRFDAAFGHGWSHSYLVALDELDADTYRVRQADGREITFRRVAGSDQRYEAPMPNDGLLVRDRRDGAIAWHWRSGRVLSFDAGKQLVRIAQAGDAITLEYDRQGRLFQAKDSQQRELTFGYYTNNRIKIIVDPAGKPFRYDYDASGNLESVTYADGTKRSYHYEDANDPHNLTGITDARGVRFASYGYDTDDRATLSAHAGDVGKVTLRYAGDRTIVTNSLGVESTYHTAYRMGMPLVTAVEGPGCSACGTGKVRYTYDDRLQLAETGMPDGRVVRRARDKQGREISVTEEVGGITRVLARIEYDAGATRPRRVLRPSVAPGRMHSMEYFYDAAGEPVTITERGFRPDGAGRYVPIERTKRLAYDNGRRVMMDGPLPGPRDRVHYDYDANGRLRAMRSPEGLVTRFEAYDAYGRPTRVRDPDDLVAEYAYNDQGQPVVLKRAGLRYTIQYDPEGHPVKLVKPDGSFITAMYDAAGRITAVKDAAGNTLNYARDTEDNLLGLDVRNALGATLLARWYAYDTENRLHSEWTHPAARTGYRYDAQGRLSERTDALGRTTRYEYDTFGMPGALIEAANTPDAAETRFDRDINGRLGAFTDPARHTTERRYDDFGNLVIEMSPDTGVRLYRYDSAGRRIAKVDESGRITHYHYDARHRLTGVGADREGASVRFHYQGTRLVRRTDPDEVIEYTYDPHGRLTQAARTLLGRRYITAYRYDAAGRLVEKRLPDQQVLRYRYDPRGGQLAAVARRTRTGDAPVASSLRYQPFGPLSAYRFGNGLRVEIAQDTAGRLRHLDNGVLRFDLDYDAAAHLTRIRSPGEDARYGFDHRDRIVTAADRHGRFAWTYDRAGNRRSQTVNGRTEYYDYEPAGNRLARRAASLPPRAPADTVIRADDDTAARATTVVYRYDPIGRPLTTGAWRYEYAGGSKPAAAYRGAEVIQYRYNANGVRTEKRRYRAGAWRGTRYLYDGPLLAAETDARGDITRQYLYLEQRPVAVLEGRRIYYVHTDYRHAPVAVTDAQQRIVWRASYQAFGTAQVNEDPDQDGKRFTLNLRLPGQYHDVETGTHYNYQRDYDPRTGRYLTPDPLGIAAGANPYTYVSNDPLTKVDPLGTYETEVHYYLTFFMARIAGLPVELSRSIALAAQYVDDNPLTQPLPTLLPPSTQRDARKLYHFTQAGYDTTTDPNTRYLLGTNITDLNPQLQNLYRPVGDKNSSRCQQAQFYGEFLHTFEDTFAHRDERNVPFGSLVGHAGAGHDPDQTYNVQNSLGTGDLLLDYADYLTNEARTLAMEEALHSRFVTDWKMTPKASFADIRDTLVAFNLAGKSEYEAYLRTHNDEESDEEFKARKANELDKKIPILSKKLEALGLGTFDQFNADLNVTQLDWYYDVDAQLNRNTFLGNLKHLGGGRGVPQPPNDPYRGILLPGD